MTSDPCARLLAAPPALPVAAHLDEVRAALPLAVVSAPPGTGKTTLIPPLVARALAEGMLAEGVRGGTDAGGTRPGRVLVIQPRRVAARAAARRLAELFGEPVGATAGYSVRGDSQVSRETRIEMITPGIAVRRLQSDPELRGIGALIFDEVHERHLDADLALALALEVRAAFRPDLLLVAMSATVESQRTAALLETGAAAPGESPRIADIPGVRSTLLPCGTPHRGAGKSPSAQFRGTVRSGCAGNSWHTWPGWWNGPSGKWNSVTYWSSSPECGKWNTWSDCSAIYLPGWRPCTAPSPAPSRMPYYVKLREPAALL